MALTIDTNSALTHLLHPPSNDYYQQNLPHILTLSDFNWEYATYLLLHNQPLNKSHEFFPKPIVPFPLASTYLQARLNVTPESDEFKRESNEPHPSITSLSSNDQISHVTTSKNKLGRSYNPGRPLGMADRQRILLLYEKGHKISHIARLIGVTHSCVSKIMTRYRRTGSMHPRSAQQSKKLNTFGKEHRTPIVQNPTPLFTLPNSDFLKHSAKKFSTPNLLINTQLTSTMTTTDLDDSFIHKPIPVKSYSITTLLN